MRVVYILIIVFLFSSQEFYACSCYHIPSFEHTISSVDKDSNILILGELHEFLERDSDFPVNLLSTTEQYRYVAVNVIEDYFENTNSEQVVLLNARPQPAFNLSIIQSDLN